MKMWSVELRPGFDYLPTPLFLALFSLNKEMLGDLMHGETNFLRNMHLERYCRDRIQEIWNGASTLGPQHQVAVFGCRLIDNRQYRQK